MLVWFGKNIGHFIGSLSYFARKSDWDNRGVLYFEIIQSSMFVTNHMIVFKTDDWQKIITYTACIISWSKHMLTSVDNKICCHHRVFGSVFKGMELLSSPWRNKKGSSRAAHWSFLLQPPLYNTKWTRRENMWFWWQEWGCKIILATCPIRFNLIICISEPNGMLGALYFWKWSTLEDATTQTVFLGI